MTAMGIALGLVAALLFGVGDLLAASVVRRVGILRLLLWIHIAAVAVATPFALFVVDLGQVPIFYWMVLAAVGLLFFGMFIAYFRAVQLTPLALVSPIVSTHVVVVILLAALLLNERLNQGQIAGMAFVVGGLIFVSLARRGSQTFLHQNSGIAFAIVATLLAGFFVFSLGFLSREFGWFIAVYCIRVSALLFIMPAYLIAHGNPWNGMSVGLVTITGLIGILFFGGLGLYALATETAPLSIVATTFSVYPVVTVAGGVLFFRERLVPRQAVGVGCVFMGLMAVTVAS